QAGRDNPYSQRAGHNGKEHGESRDNHHDEQAVPGEFELSGRRQAAATYERADQRHTGDDVDIAANGGGSLRVISGDQY
ncbi:hypothetical protein QP260_23515, partial [Escherichia coli]|nr:hypothetical protein [Escherichia coli]